jgi:putative ABC transport system ATP-binding protein
VNSALAALLRGNNTTISIAHRLSTIKRSDEIIVLSPDGTVAEQGSYQDLSSRPDGAFTKLMEWQLSGGDNLEPPRAPREADKLGPPTEHEDALDEIHEDETEESREKENQGKVEAVVEKVDKQ